MLDTALGAPVIESSRNDQVDWSLFDPNRYHETNYRRLRADDAAIMYRIQDFFARSGVSGGRGLDVGTGTNLYPALAMLPFCSTLDLWEYSAANFEWLEHQVQRFDADWEPFWALYQRHPKYQFDVDQARVAFRERASIKHASVFDLPPAAWDMGTLFFVACSISAGADEFQHALRQFIGALRPGAPFAAAFMKGSKGYSVGDRRFPAAPIGPVDVHRCIADLVESLFIHDVASPDPLRKDAAMMIATGYVRGGRS